METKKPLTECLGEEERRKYYPQLCTMADWLEQANTDTDKLIKALVWIIRQRRRERDAL